MHLRRKSCSDAIKMYDLSKGEVIQRRAQCRLVVLIPAGDLFGELLVGGRDVSALVNQRLSFAFLVHRCFVL